jgi:cell division protease FtsH
MIKTYGMSAKLGQVSFDKDRRTLLNGSVDAHGRGDYSEETAREIDNEVRRLIDEQRERVSEILAERHEVLLDAAKTLLAKETISGDELRAIVRAHDELAARQGHTDHAADAEAEAEDGAAGAAAGDMPAWNG